MLDTTLSRRKALQVGAAAAGLTLLPARRASAQDKTITFWNLAGIYDVEDPNDKTKKPEDFYISQAIGRFEAANPGLTVQMESLPGDTSAFTKYRTASVAKNGPDIMGVWSGSYMLALKDFLEPMAPFFTAEERSRILGWDAVSVDFKADSDQIFGVPASSDGTTCVFYNKELLDKAGVDPEGDWRTSFDAFVEALDAIKASGTTPLALDENCHHLADPGLVAGTRAGRLRGHRGARLRDAQLRRRTAARDRGELAEAECLHRSRRRDDAGRLWLSPDAAGRCGGVDRRLLGHHEFARSAWRQARHGQDAELQS